VEGTKLRDYEGSYERFLEKNEDEAEVMAEKEAKKKELDKSQIKAKSKARFLHRRDSLQSGQYGRLTSSVLLQMSKAEKQMQKKEKAKAFTAKKSEGKVAKNSKRWN
jgi:hypothetical protein